MLETLSRRARARRHISTWDLGPAIEMAKQYFGLKPSEVKDALRDYHQFMYLVYWKHRRGLTFTVVPTVRADKIWHGHLLVNEDYNRFCQKLIDGIVPHRPGLQPGTKEMIEAMAYTKLLHLENGMDGFHEGYFGHVKVKRAERGKDTSSSGGDDGMLYIHLASANDSDSDSGGDSGGDGGGCGD